MDVYLFSVFSALWLGLLTSISPCPLATNIAAITFISRSIKESRMCRILFCGLSYSLGRMAIYSFLAMALMVSVRSIPAVSFFLQKYINIALGPLLILCGMFMLELLSFSLGSGAWSSSIQNKFRSNNSYGAFFLGAVFALAFCPISAALYFGSLLPLAIKSESSFMVPAVYGFGTAIPVIAVSMLIGFGVKSLSDLFSRIKAFELIARRVTGVIFIVVGIYFIAKYIFQIDRYF